MSLVRRTAGPEAEGRDQHSPVANRSVGRALAILELLSRNERPMNLAEISSELKLPKSSALTLLRALVSSEFCTLDDRAQYALGVHSFEVGAAYLRSMTPVRSVAPELEWLTDHLGVTSHFAVLEHDQVIYLAKHDPPHLGLKLASSVGARLPAAVTAVGKAQLAYEGMGGPGAVGAPLAGIASSRSLADELGEVRQLGYAVDEGETASGIRCVAAPIFNDRGCCGAIGVSYLVGDVPAPDDAARAVMDAARRASARLGGGALGTKAGSTGVNATAGARRGNGAN